MALQIGCWLTEPAKNRDGRANEPFVSKAKTSVRSSSALKLWLIRSECPWRIP